MRNRNLRVPSLSKLDESLLCGLPPFLRLSRPQIREILDRATPRRYPEGTAVFSEGATADRFYLLLDGYIRVVRTTPAGEQVIVLHIPPGQLFGIAPAIGRGLPGIPPFALRVTLPYGTASISGEIAFHGEMLSA